MTEKITHIDSRRGAPGDDPMKKLLPDNADPEVVSPHPTILRLHGDPNLAISDESSSPLRRSWEAVKDIARTAINRFTDRNT
jgi:hypothetical protein